MKHLVIGKMKKITKYFNPYKNTIIKLLTYNHIVMKEINRASKVNPVCNIKNIKSIFLNIYDIYKKFYKIILKLLYF